MVFRRMIDDSPPVVTSCLEPKPHAERCRAGYKLSEKIDSNDSYALMLQTMRPVVRHSPAKRLHAYLWYLWL